MDIPKHIAIIMDGNGRWAVKRSLSRIAGHKEGIKTVEEIIKASNEIGITVLTLYAFSTENWARPLAEVKGLFSLLKFFLRKKIKEFQKNNIKLKTIGNISKLPADVVKEIKSAIKITSENTGLIVNIALNYGGIKNIDEKNFEKYIYTAGLPDPDLIIRTSGEYRISNFLMWQSAYSEFYTTNILWPDFKKKDLLDAISEYNRRNRRFGGLEHVK